MSKYPILTICNGCHARYSERHELTRLEPPHGAECTFCHCWYPYIYQYEDLGLKDDHGQAAKPAPWQGPRKKDTRAYSRENWRSWIESET